MLGLATLLPLRPAHLNETARSGLFAASALWSRLCFSRAVTGWVSLCHAGAQHQGTTFSNSSIGNKADILISIWLLPLSSLSRCQTLKVWEKENKDLSVLSNTNLAPKDKCCFRAIKQNVKMLQDPLKGVTNSAMRLEVGFVE